MGVLDKFMLFAAGKAARSTLPPTPATPTQKKVLIAVADEALKNEYMKLLQAENVNVESVADGAQGLNMLLTYQPDLILLDLVLPVMDGKTMLHHMRALPAYKTTPVVAVSDTGDVDTMRQVKTYDNASAFFVKSTVTPEDIINTLKLLL